MKEIITIQHAESLQHVNGMVGGWTDWELTDRGKKQAEAIGRNLSKRMTLGKEYIMYSSDLMRTRQTAEICGSYLGLSPILTESLREIYFGSATGQSMEWMRVHALPGSLAEPGVHYRNLPDAESLYDVYLRLSPFIDSLLASEHERFIVVSHSAALGMFFSRWLQLDVEQVPNIRFAGEAAGVSKLCLTDEKIYMLCYLNDTSDWSQEL